MQSEPHTVAPDGTWEQLAPLLEDAMGQLGDQDRAAVVLRFFGGKSFVEVGTAAGVSENAAKKRVSHALEKLHRYFAKRGVISTAAIIAGTISTHSVQAAPAALATSVTALALAKGAAASSSTLALIQGVLKIMAWTKAKLAIVAATGLILATSVSVVVVEKTSLFQGKTESEWIKSIVYFGDSDQTELWRSLGPRGVQMLVRALKSPTNDHDIRMIAASHGTRMRAASLLSQLGNDAKSAIPELIDLLKTETDQGVRGIELAYFEGPIENMDEKEKAALFPELLRAMQSKSSSVRNNALVALQFYPDQTETVVPLMVKSLQDPNPQVRLMAVKALNRVDPQNAATSDFVRVLVGCLTGPPGDTPGAANEAVIMLGNLHRAADLAVPALIQSLQSADPYIRQNSAAALGRFGGQAKPAESALQNALEDSDANVRRQAAAALKRINSGAAAN